MGGFLPANGFPFPNCFAVAFENERARWLGNYLINQLTYDLMFRVSGGNKEAVIDRQEPKLFTWFHGDSENNVGNIIIEQGELLFTGWRGFVSVPVYSPMDVGLVRALLLVSVAASNRTELVKLYA